MHTVIFTRDQKNTINMATVVKVWNLDKATYHFEKNVSCLE